MTKNITLLLCTFILFVHVGISQENVQILDYSVNNSGQVQLEIEGQSDQYYILSALHEPNLNYEANTSITMGEDGNMIISEPLAAYPLQNYKVTAYPIEAPNDTDGDEIDDIEEFNNMPTDAPLNFAEAISFVDGTTSIDNAETFASLAVIEDVPWAPFLNGSQFVKFGILDIDTDEPKVYFINSSTHFIHGEFFDAIGANVPGDDGSGEIAYNPNEILPNGVIGSYSFNFSFGESKNFETTQKTFELLAANMPFLQNNLQHFIGDAGENQYENIYKNDYEGSRINVVLESEVFADVDFLPFNNAEGFGFFRKMELDENPNSRDIVLYDALPNSLPRVGGIITSVVQTPLSHVNLRAIQDNVPNAYIKNPLEIDSIANLLGNYIYYKVEQDKYTIREASLEEVNDWFENIRPTEEQIPERDLSQQKILPLDSITFYMADIFGAKCTNVATMRTFGFPEGTIPNGYGIPFYFYDEFMKFNGFYDRVEEMIADPDFELDLETRIDMLKDLRKDIKAAEMPDWMYDELQVMQESFPEGTSIRCRSSTNNEDLPGFSGAGLYTSKTQHPEEGHIEKSVKQVYASMWNFRAYDEREFYRVDQYIAAMGILCHPNFQEEKSNGVGVSIDPIFNTENTFYLNTQVGEFLITNPDANSIPEEILLNTDPEEGYFVLRYSNLVENEELVMAENYLDQMRDYLQVIHDEFAILYNVVGAEGFGMDIEYKVTAEDQLIIKQARPWVSFWSEINSTYDLAVIEITEPSSSSTLGIEELVTARIENQGLKSMEDFEVSLLIDDAIVETIIVSDTLNPRESKEYQFTTPQDLSAIGDYGIGVIVNDEIDGYSRNDTLKTVVSKIYFLEGGLVTVLDGAKCGQEVDVIAQITNYGEASFANTEIEVIVNGMAVDTVNYDFNIPYLVTVEVPVTVTENLMATDNIITLNLLTVNASTDEIADNNLSSITTDLNSNFDNITLVINTDNYSEETSWNLLDQETNELIASDILSPGLNIYTQDVCVNYASCFRLEVYDTYGDGICCGYGLGNFYLLNSAGDTLFVNDGDFGSEAEEIFCPNGCFISADITTEIASSETAADGIITINPMGESENFQFSIDGGENFVTSSVFENLTAGIYEIVVLGDTENCIFETTIELEYDITNSVSNQLLNQIKLFPNPAYETVMIEVNQDISLSTNLKVDIYNSLGVLIKSDESLNFDSEFRTQIALDKYSSGAYTIRIYNNDFEKYFKLIKI